MRSAFVRSRKPICWGSIATSPRKPATDIAGAYIDRLEAACMALERFPRRGTRRDDIRPGLRTMGFERRATIVFQVKRSEAVIVRIFHGGQEFERALRGTAEA